MRLAPLTKKHLILYPAASTHSTARKETQSIVANYLTEILHLSSQPQSMTSKPVDAEDYYYLPERLLLTSEAEELGIQSINDLYGGVVPFAFLLTKTLSYPLHQQTMSQPEGWNNELGFALRPYVGVGYSAFSAQDTLWTAEGLLHKGPVRFILTHTNGSVEEIVINNHVEASHLLDQAHYQPLLEKGVVILEYAEELSHLIIGQTEINGECFSYFKEKTLKGNLKPTSSLYAVKGNYEKLSQQLHEPYHLKALHITQQYENIIFSYFPEIYTSRRAYKIVKGNNYLGEEALTIKEPLWCMDENSIDELNTITTLIRDSHSLERS